MLWVFDAFSKQHVLRLSGPASATTGEVVDVTVVDGQDGSPVAGAEVRGEPTGVDGHARFAISEAGVYRIKATRADSVRSNALNLCVDPPGAEPCTSSDRTRPDRHGRRARLRERLAIGKVRDQLAGERRRGRQRRRDL